MIPEKNHIILKCLPLLALIIAFTACYYNTFQWLQYKYSYRDSYYSHGYLIPFVSMYLMYLLKDKLKNCRIKGNNTGLVIVVFSLLIHIIAVMSDINFISGFSILIFIPGCLLYLIGYQALKIIAFPVFFLIFMFPIPNAFINTIGLPTKSFATEIGMMIVRMVDIPYFREGFKIHLTDSIMFVGTPCNGMKSLISFAALALLSAYMLNLNIKKSILVLIGVYPIAVILNGLRIAILIFIADKFGIEKAAPESLFHDLSGLVVFIIGIAIIFLSIGLLERTKINK